MRSFAIIVITAIVFFSCSKDKVEIDSNYFEVFNVSLSQIVTTDTDLEYASGYYTRDNNYYYTTYFTGSDNFRYEFNHFQDKDGRINTSVEYVYHNNELVQTLRYSWNIDEKGIITRDVKVDLADNKVMEIAEYDFLFDQVEYDKMIHGETWAGNICTLTEKRILNEEGEITDIIDY